MLPAADTAAELVKLGQSEAVGIFNDHQGGVGHINAHLDHRRRHEEVGFLRR